MNKYLFLGLCFSLSAFAQEYNNPSVEMASETVAVPEIIEPLAENPIDPPAQNAAATAPTEEFVPEAPEAATAETPDYETKELSETETVDAAIPVVKDTAPEVKSKELITSEIPSATPTLTTGVEEEKNFNPYASHWNVLFNFETLKYPTPYKYSNNTSGKFKKEIDEPETEMYGGRLGFGRDFYLGAGFITTSRVEGYYMGSLFSEEKNVTVSEQTTTPAATSKTSGSIYGLDASQSLGWSFDFKTKNPMLDEVSYLVVEPFIEAGIGLAQAVNKTSFNAETSEGLDKFSHRMSDQLANARVGAGINLTSLSGFYFFMRATVNRYEVVNRDQKINSFLNGTEQATTEDEPEKKLEGPLVIYALGGGYKF